jgi:hypothetical protein
MANLKQIADVLIGSWTVANEGAPLPTGQGVLDRALKRVIDQGNFPEYVRKALHFVPTTVGVRCAELRAILVWAQAAEQTSDPNPSYMVTKPKGSHEAALGLLYDVDIDEEDARRWGQALAEAVKLENQKLGDFENALRT